MTDWEKELDALEKEEPPHDVPRTFQCPDCGEAGLTLEEFDTHGGGMCEELPYRGGTSDMPYLD